MPACIASLVLCFRDLPREYPFRGVEPPTTLAFVENLNGAGAVLFYDRTEGATGRRTALGTINGTTHFLFGSIWHSLLPSPHKRTRLDCLLHECVTHNSPPLNLTVYPLLTTT